MNDAKNVQEMIEALQREIIDLKVSHNIAPNVETFAASITPSSTRPITITYDDGEYDIISDCYSTSDAVLGPITSNSQRLYHSGDTSSEITVVSTRPILSVAQ